MVQKITIDGSKNCFNYYPFPSAPVPPADFNPTKAFSNVLAKGIQYRIIAEGLYWEAGPHMLRTDARFADPGGNSVWDDRYPFTNFNSGLQSDVLSGIRSPFTALNDVRDSFWGVYNASHVYSYDFVGTGERVDFYFADRNCHRDNGGSLTVLIFK